MCKYYNDSKFKPGDMVYYKGSVEVHGHEFVVGCVVTLQEATDAYLKRESSTTPYRISQRAIQDDTKAIFAQFENAKSIGWMPERSLAFFTDSMQLLYKEKIYVRK